MQETPYATASTQKLLEEIDTLKQQLAASQSETTRLKTDFALVQDKFLKLLENNPNAVAFYRSPNDGQDFFFSYFNHTGEQIENIKRAFLLGKNVLAVFPEVEKFGLLAVFKRVWKTGISENYPISFYKDDRISGWRENLVIKISPDEIAAIYSDETKNKQGEQEITRLAAIIEASPDFISYANLNGEVIYINDAGRQLTGIKELNSGEQNYGSIAHFHPPSIFKKIKNEAIPVAIKDNIWKGESEIYNARGELIPTLQIVMAHKNSLGEVAFLSTIIKDISKNKQFESDLIAAKALAETANQAKSLFLASMSHEIRTPMNAILGFNQLSLMTNDTTKLREYAGFIQHSSQHLLKLINDILDLSRLESGPLNLVNAQFDLSETFQQALDTVLQNNALANCKPATMAMKFESNNYLLT